METRTLSVLIPTWRRPASLARCVRALGRQTRKVDQIVVTIREDDADTWAIIPELEREIGPALQVVNTPAVNLTTAMNLGLGQTTGALVALTDDDAEAHDDWLEKLEAGFTSEDIGGVGGRDWQPIERGNRSTVGRLSWYGRVVGNHHLGAGSAREVELLKGVNCCFRGEVIRRIGFDRRLRGRGNVSHWEMSLCFAILREGFKLIYDPAIAVDHHVEVRHDGDINARGGFEPKGYADSVHNEVVAISSHLGGIRRLAFLAYHELIGTAGAPGLLQVPRRVIQFRKPLSLAMRRYRAARAGARRARQTLAEAKHNSPEPMKGHAACE